MIDPPSAEALIDAVAHQLGQPRNPTAKTARFEDRVAVNALQIALRELYMRDSVHAAEHARLCELLDESGELEILNRILSERLLAGSLDPEAEDVRNHLWVTTMAKLSIDQPSYASFKAETGNQGCRHS